MESLDSGDAAANAELANGSALEPAVLIALLAGAANCVANSATAEVFLRSIRRSAKARAGGLNGIPPKRNGGTVIGMTWIAVVETPVSPVAVASRVYAPNEVREMSLKMA